MIMRLNLWGCITMKKFFLILCCAGMLSTVVYADDNPVPQQRRMRRGQNGGRRGQNGGQRGQRGQRGNIGQMMFARILAEEKIAAAAPEKYAALEAAREKYEAELEALAKETGVTLPQDRDSALRKIRKKFPAEFAAIMKKVDTDFRQAMVELQQLAEKAGVRLGGFRNSGNNRGRQSGDGNGMAPRNISMPNMGELRRKYPEQMRKYDELRRTDRKAAEQMLREIIKQHRKEKP